MYIALIRTSKQTDGETVLFSFFEKFYIMYFIILPLNIKKAVNAVVIEYQVADNVFTSISET